MNSKKVPLSFTAQEVYFNDAPPKREDFEEIEEIFHGHKQYEDNLIYYTISTKLTDTYFWLSASYGSPNPRPTEILNTDDFSTSANPRNSNEVEQREQLFLIITFCDSSMYISNIRQKGFIKKLFEEKLKKNVIIKDIFKSIEEFYNVIRQIDKICFTSKKRDLFSKIGDINQVLSDNYGMEEPDEFSVEAKYSRPLTSRIRNTIKKLMRDDQLKKIIIKGRDDDNFEKVFNNDTFTQKLIICLEKSENGLFNDIMVRDAVLDKLGTI